MILSLRSWGDCGVGYVYGWRWVSYSLYRCRFFSEGIRNIIIRQSIYLLQYNSYTWKYYSYSNGQLVAACHGKGESVRKEMAESGMIIATIGKILTGKDLSLSPGISCINLFMYLFIDPFTLFRGCRVGMFFFCRLSGENALTDEIDLDRVEMIRKIRLYFWAALAKLCHSRLNSAYSSGIGGELCSRNAFCSSLCGNNKIPAVLRIDTNIWIFQLTLFLKHIGVRHIFYIKHPYHSMKMALAEYIIAKLMGTWRPNSNQRHIQFMIADFAWDSRCSLTDQMMLLTDNMTSQYRIIE